MQRSRLAILALVSFAVASAAGVPDDLVEALDADDLAARDAATAELLTDESLTLAQIEDRLRSGDLSPEQRARLESVGLERFARQPKAGLGVRFGTGTDSDGVPLAAVLDEFPAAEHLKPGDVVRTINGQTVTRSAHMGAIILSHLPGETLRIEVDRPVPVKAPPPGGLPGGNVQPPAAEPEYERVTLDVPLGSYEQLETGQRLTPSRLGPAYRQRLARREAEGGGLPVIGGGITPKAWLRAEGYDTDAGLAPQRRLQSINAWRHIAFGGQPDSAVSREELRRGDINAAVVRANRALQADGEYDMIEEALAGFRALSHRLTELDAELARIDADPESMPSERRLRSLRVESDLIEQSLTDIRELFERVTQAPTD